MAHTCSREKLEAQFPWMKWYNTKKWTVYELLFPEDEGELASLQESYSEMDRFGLIDCGAGSEVSVSHVGRGGLVNDLFFFDLEQTEGMGFPEVQGPMVEGIQTRPWHGHPAGSVVLAVYRWANGSRSYPSGACVGVAPYVPSEESDKEAFNLVREELAKGMSEEGIVALLFGAGDYSTWQATELLRQVKRACAS